MPFDPGMRTWHITFGTYATRLHSDPRPTVDRRHHHRGEPFPAPDATRQCPPAGQPLMLNIAQRGHIETVLPGICDRGRWVLRAVAAPHPGDHVHVLLDAATTRPPKAIRQWLKRWLSESMDEAFGHPPRGWWAQGGSTKPVTDEAYLRNVTQYITRQRTLP